MTAGERSLYVATVAILLAVSAVGLALWGSGAAGGTAPEPPSTAEADFQVTDDGTRYTVHPSRLQQGCPGGTDCIPSIDDEPVRFSLADGRLVDAAGDEWSFDGEALEGPHAGTELERLILSAISA